MENFGPDLPKYCLKCVKCGRLILRKITEIVPTTGHIFMLNCTKFHFGWDFAPDPTGGAYSAPSDPLAGFKGPTSTGREGKGGVGKGRMGKGGKGGKKRGWEGEGNRDEGRVRSAFQQIKIYDYTPGYSRWWAPRLTVLLMQCISELSMIVTAGIISNSLAPPAKHWSKKPSHSQYYKHHAN